MNDKQDGFNYKRYAEGIESALEKIAVKNKLVEVNQIQLETAIPRDLIIEILDRETVQFPDRVKRIIDEKEGKTWKR